MYGERWGLVFVIGGPEGGGEGGIEGEGASRVPAGLWITAVSSNPVGSSRPSQLIHVRSPPPS